MCLIVQTLNIKPCIQNTSRRKPIMLYCKQMIYEADQERKKKKKSCRVTENMNVWKVKMVRNIGGNVWSIHLCCRFKYKNLDWHKSWLILKVQFSSAAQSCPTLCDPMNDSTPGLPGPSPTPGMYPNLCPLSWRCSPTITFSVVPFSSCPQSFPVSGSFQMSQFFTSGGQNIEVSASTSILPTNTQDWSLLGWTGWISLQSKGLSRVFSNTTVQKHQFFCAQLSL